MYCRSLSPKDQKRASLQPLTGGSNGSLQGPEERATFSFSLLLRSLCMWIVGDLLKLLGVELPYRIFTCRITELKWLLILT